MGFLVFRLENSCKPFAHSVVMTTRPVNPTTFAACMESVVALPDIGRYPALDGFPIHLTDNLIAREAATERIHVAQLEIQTPHHLYHLLKWIIILNKDQWTVFKPQLQPR
jgi:hypothetical protein